MNVPNRTSTRQSLLFEVRHLDVLWSAWRSVRGRALLSGDPAIQSDARDFDQNPSKHIRELQERLRHGKFEFAPQTGVLKFKLGKKTPRPIVVSPLRNRLVQRAILDVLQSTKPKIITRLGEVPCALATPTSVGGIPGRGSPQAVELIRSWIAKGATHFVRSDIKDFFTRVPKARLLEFLRTQTSDNEFVDFIAAGLAVELANAEIPKVREWIDLFPTGNVGVPQGSSLSALCANVVLRDFDAEFNRRGIRTVRYIDDFVMLSDSETKLQLAWNAADRMLRDLGLEAHSPFPGSSKAAHGAVRDGFEFLSYRFQGNRISPSPTAKQKLLSAIQETIRSAKQSISKQGSAPRRSEDRFAQVLTSIDRRLRGWGDAFRDVDQRVEFAQLDEQVGRLVDDFMSWHLAHAKRADLKTRMRHLGIAQLSDTPRPSQDKLNIAA
jgi:RNA-directed DNA polymerase